MMMVDAGASDVGCRREGGLVAVLSRVTGANRVCKGRAISRIDSLAEFSPDDETSYQRKRQKLHRRKLASQPHRRIQRLLVLRTTGRGQMLQKRIDVST